MLMAAGIAAARARLRPRLPARRRRAQDEQVAGQRARPVRGHRPLRHRRAALLPAARRHLRRGRQRLDGGRRAPLRERAGQRATATSPAARSRWSRRYRDGAVPGRAELALGEDFDGLATSVDRRLADAELTGALEEIWQRVRRLNRYVEEQAPWELAKDEARAGELDVVLATLAEGLRASPSLLHAVHARDDREAARALGDDDAARRAGSARAGSSRSTSSSRCSPRRARVIDCHTHLDSCAPPDAELVAEAEAAGVTRILTVGTDGASSPRGARGGRGTSRRSSPRSAATPTTRRASTTPSSRELRELAAHPRCRAIGETGLDYFRDYAPRADQERAFLAQIELARERRQAARHPHARGRGRHDRARCASAPTASTVILHCFSMPDRLDECLAEGWWISFAGQRHLPEGARPGRRRRARARRPPAGRDRRAVPDAAGRAQGAQPAGLRRAHRARSSPSAAGRRYEELEARRRGATRARAASGGDRRAPARSRRLRRLRQFGVRPKRDLGPELPRSTRTSSASSSAPPSSAPDDVVLEIGGGLGVLSEHLAERVRARARRRARPRAGAGAARRARPARRTRRCTSPTR